MDIGSGNGYPESSLSNFAPHTFYLDGVLCNSMEGFLQSLKFSSEEMQRYVCTLVGKEAKFKGKKKNWWHNQTLYWHGMMLKRDSFDYQVLLWRAFEALSKNKSFAKALLATGNATLKHSLGKNDITKTVLTEREFCSILSRIRKELITKTENK